MSVDIAVFAEQSKTWIFLDRSRYLMPGGCSDFVLGNATRYGLIYKKLDCRESVSRDEMMYFLKQNLQFTDAEDSREQSCVRYNSQKAFNFVETRPVADVTFTVRTDNESQDCYELAERGGYTRVDENDPRKLHIVPVYVEKRTPEQIAIDDKNAHDSIADLVKALEAGHHPGLPLAGGSELVIEDLDMTGMKYQCGDVIGYLWRRTDGGYDLVDDLPESWRKDRSK